nr:GDP-mannose 4,6-dehydratase [Micromonospora sp. DSM 115978]
MDNFVNSSPRAVERVRKIAGGELEFVELDLRNRAALAEVFDGRQIDSVVHFAALKAVGESVDLPLEYYDTNVTGTLGLIAAMRDHDVQRLVFSSSCAVYGNVETVPIREDTPANPASPYARTKWMCEVILADFCVRYPDWRVTSLRY